MKGGVAQPAVASRARACGCMYIMGLALLENLWPCDAEYRAETLRLATSKQLDVCICTSAFGMGIDVCNIDTVLHVDPPKSLSELAQQIGRAGRDGSQAKAVMMFHPGKISQCFSLWVANKSIPVMNQNFTDYQKVDKKSWRSFIHRNAGVNLSGRCWRILRNPYLSSLPAKLDCLVGTSYSCCPDFPRCSSRAAPRNRRDVWAFAQYEQYC